MKVPTWVASMVVGCALAWSATSAAQAQTVTFSDINVATPGTFFNATASKPDLVNRNKLIIGLGTGLDQALLKFRGFTASTAAFRFPSAMDTISFRIHAPAGFHSGISLDFPVSLGSYTCYLPGQFTTIAGNEGKPVGNLYFAGEHANSFYDFQGCMEGAALSGIDAAAAILRAAKLAA